MKYLGIDPEKPKIGVFDFTSCEGCELQLANKEDTLVDFLKSVDIVVFREASSDQERLLAGEGYDIALVEGAITRSDEVERLKAIREKAKVLVALGSCAAFGGINKLKNAYDVNEANKLVYGDLPKETEPARAVGDVVQVDLAVPGCPVSKAEVEKIVQHLVWGTPFRFPSYPVCLECKQRFNLCLFDLGLLCMGPITMGGCDAPCPSGGLECRGCRGPAVEHNYKEFLKVARDRGFGDREISEKLNFFGAFEVEI